jgi:enoyl-CoA hydratase/carnithine racemase
LNIYDPAHRLLSARGRGELRREICSSPGSGSAGTCAGGAKRERTEAALDTPLDAALSRSTVAQQAIFDSLYLQEGAAAFLAKREPVFEGR